MISQQEQAALQESLYYLHVAELKKICQELGIPDSGKKAPLIERILTFIATGMLTTKTEIPNASKAKKGVDYPLHSDTLVLHGAYKNDLKTRNFMKTLVGEHFYFTVFGHDWIKERWMQSNPPTYAEFAQFWQYAYQETKNKKNPLKQEWALLNFMRRYRDEFPEASNIEVMSIWKETRNEHVARVFKILNYGCSE